MRFRSSCIERSPILMATMSISQRERERTCRPACASAGGRDARDASARGTRRAGGRSRRPGRAHTRRAAAPRERVLCARGRPASAGATRALASTARDAAPARGNEHELHHCDEEPVNSTLHYVQSIDVQYRAAHLHSTQMAHVVRSERATREAQSAISLHFCFFSGLQLNCFRPA